MKIENGANFGDMKKFIVRINDSDVTEAVVSAHVFQDMFAPTNTAIVNFNDTNNLLMNLPIRAGSRLVIEVETELDSIGDGEKTWEFIVYRVGEKEMVNAKQQTYSVFGAAEAFVLNQTKRIWRAYSDQKTTDAAQNIYKEYLNSELVVEPTDNNIQMMVPGWSPFATISWLLKVSVKSKAADYVVFQQHDGKFAMKTFETLYSSSSESSGITFDITPTNIRDDGETTHDYATSINKYQFEHFDALTNLSSGYYQSKTASYDIINKTWSVKSFNFGDDNSDDKKVSKLDSNLFTDAGDVNISFIPKHPGLFDKPSYLDTADTWQGSRKSSMMKFEQEKLLIQIPGSAKSAEWFGKNCEVDLPSQDFQSDEMYDKQRRGRYLITSMAHMYNKDAYIVNAELVKKRLEE